MKKRKIMSIEKIVIIGLWIFILLGGIFAGVVAYESYEVEDLSISSETTVVPDTVVGDRGKTLTTGTTDQGDVSISLTPQGVKDGTFVVAFAVNTHSVDLSVFDLTQIVTLEYDGKKIAPVSAPRMNGHHVNGVMVFTLKKAPEQFKITMAEIPLQEKRVYQWA